MFPTQLHSTIRWPFNFSKSVCFGAKRFLGQGPGNPTEICRRDGWDALLTGVDVELTKTL